VCRVAGCMQDGEGCGWNRGRLLARHCPQPLLRGSLDPELVPGSLLPRLIPGESPDRWSVCVQVCEAMRKTVKVRIV
jgi:hypothetical protein